MMGCPAPRTWLNVRSDALWVFGAHHKSGTTLSEQLGRMWALWFNATYVNLNSFGTRCESMARYDFAAHRNATLCGGREIAVSRCFDAPAFQQISRLASASGRPLRVVHFVREPISLVVSGYYYHRRCKDRQGMSPKRVGKEVLQNLSLDAGLLNQAKETLRHTLPEMFSALRATDNDSRVLTISETEVAGPSFSPVVSRILEHFMSIGVLQLADPATLIRQTDERVNVVRQVTPVRHVNSNENRLEALRAIETSNQSGWWDLVRDYRALLSFQEKTKTNASSGEVKLDHSGWELSGGTQQTRPCVATLNASSCAKLFQLVSDGHWRRRRDWLQ